MFEYLLLVLISMAMAMYLTKLVQFIGLIINKTKPKRTLTLPQDESWKIGKTKFLKPLNK